MWKLLSGRQRTSLFLLLGWVATLLFAPVATIIQLNIEDWATSNNLHKLYDGHNWDWFWSAWTELWSWVSIVLNFVTGPFGGGFALAAVIFSFWDPLARYSAEYFGPGDRLSLVGGGEESVGKVWRNGVPYDTMRLLVRNEPDNRRAERVRVRLVSVLPRNSKPKIVNRFLSFAPEEFLTNISPGNEKVAQIFESKCRAVSSIPVETPSINFGPLKPARGRDRYLRYGPGRYIITLEATAVGFRSVSIRYDIVLSRGNKLLMRPYRPRKAEQFARAPSSTWI